MWASPGCGTAGQWCSARVVGGAEAGSLASEWPLLSGQREAHQGVGVAGVQHGGAELRGAGGRRSGSRFAESRRPPHPGQQKAHLGAGVAVARHTKSVVPGVGGRRRSSRFAGK